MERGTYKLLFDKKGNNSNKNCKLHFSDMLLLGTCKIKRRDKIRERERDKQMKSYGVWESSGKRSGDDRGKSEESDQMYKHYNHFFCPI